MLTLLIIAALVYGLVGYITWVYWLHQFEPAARDRDDSPGFKRIIVAFASVVSLFWPVWWYALSLLGSSLWRAEAVPVERFLTLRGAQSLSVPQT